jgi:ATP-binding cassette subfamily B protein
MPQRAAFERARRFLWYRPAPATFAILLTPVSGFLLLILVTLIGLLLDLAVNRGIVADHSSAQRWSETYLEQNATQLVQVQTRQGQSLGLASLAIRVQDRWYGGFISALATRFPDLWNNYWYLLMVSSAILISSLLLSGVSYLQKRTAAAAAIDATTRLRRSVHQHAYRIGSLTLRTISDNQVIGSSMRALDTLQEGLFAWFQSTIQGPLHFFLLLVYLLLLDAMQGQPWISLLALAAVGLYWLVAAWITTWARRAERQDALRSAEGQSLLTESLNLSLVKGYAMESYHNNRLERLLHRQAQSVQSRWYWQFLARHGRWALIAILGSVLAFAIVGNMLEGNLRFVPIVLMFLTIYCMYVVAQRWQKAWHQVHKARTAAVSIFQLLDRRTDVKQVVGAEFLPRLADSLELVNITVSIPGTDSLLLNGVSMTIGAGEKVALVGDERARLIVAYLLSRLIDPDSGEVRFDDKPLQWVTLESVRHQVALVLQDDLIFNDTVANNISCGDEQYALPRIVEAAKAAHAHHFIMKLPNGYETAIGDLGESLTLSQCFRIALARAVLREPPVVVIEEPSSALTEEDKSWFDDTMNRFLQGRTVILLPSRLSTIRRADRVIMLHQGEVVDEGSDSDLVVRSERYKHWQYLRFHAFQEEPVAKEVGL